MIESQIDIAANVAASLTQVDGVIYKAESQNQHRVPPEDWAACSCTLSFHAWRATLNPEMIAAVEGCLQGTVERYPDYATASALLALVEIDRLRSQFPYDIAASGTSLETALANARRASALDPQNVRALQAEMLALFFSGDFTAGRMVASGPWP